MEIALLQSHPLLSALPPEELVDVAEKCALKRLEPGEPLLTRGQENHTLFFLLSGSLRVNLDAADSANGFEIPPGEIIGEMSIIERTPAMAWVVAKDSSVLLAMTERYFWSRYIGVPQAMRALLYLLISRVRKTNSVLLKEFAQKIRYEIMRTELESAWRIQTNLLPTVRPFFPEHPAVDSHAMIRPAREVGGDFFDAIPLDKTRVCLAVGDVSGKGLPASLFMVRVVTLLRMALLQTPDPALVLPTLNRFLCTANDECMFVTLAIMILDTSSGNVVYLNGGHNAAYFARAGKNFEILSAPTGMLLGVNPNAKFATQELQLAPGDTILLYTDGVPEAENPSGAFYSDQNALNALNEITSTAALPNTVDALIASLSSFVSTAQQSDDITLLAFRYLGAQAPRAEKTATTFFTLTDLPPKLDSQLTESEPTESGSH